MHLATCEGSCSKLSTLLYIVLIAALLATNTLAAALPQSDSNEVEKRAPPTTDPYPDVTGCENAYIADQKPTVFFSNLGTTASARTVPDRFAATIGGKTFKGAFGQQAEDPTKTFTDRRTGPGSRIFYLEFAKRASLVMAQQATGIAYVLLRDTTGPNGPIDTSVWTKLERPALEANAAVTKIVRVDPVTFVQTDLFVRDSSASQGKRSFPGNTGSDVVTLNWDAPADGPYFLAPDQ